MSADNITSNRTQCRPEFDYLRPADFKTTGQVGEALIDGFESKYLKQGERLCYQLEANNLVNWFIYRPRETDAAAQSSSWDLKETFSLLGAIALFSLFVTAAFKTIIEGATYATGGVDDLLPANEGVAQTQVEAEAETPVALEMYGLKNEQWWLGLTETDRRRMGMVIERELPRALEDEEFRRLHLDDAGRVTPEGLRSLLGSQGNVDHPLGRIDARSDSMEVRGTERGASDRPRDVARSLKAVK